MPLVKRGASARKVLTVHASTLEEVALHPIASLVPFNYTLALAGDSIHANMITNMERFIFRLLPLTLSEEATPMKPLMVAALLAAFSTVLALAKPNPIERLPDINENMGSVGAMQENTGSIGAMREREYFGPPQLPVNAFRCRLEPVLFNKVRLARYC